MRCIPHPMERCIHLLTHQRSRRSSWRTSEEVNAMTTKLLEIIALVILLLCVLDGLHRGLVMQVFSLVRIVLILVLTVVLVPLILPMITEENAARNGIAYIAALVVALVAVSVVAHLLRIVERIPVVKTVNRLGGGILGACIGIVLIWVALAVIGAFQDAEWCREIAACAKGSDILRTIQRFDPMMYVLKHFDFPSITASLT